MLVYILGFPHTATTFIYKYILSRLPNHLGVFEPFNAEVVGWCMHGDMVQHYSDGAVCHDFRRLPKHLRDMIVENAKWFNDWVQHDIPLYPFCGLRFHEIFKEISKLENIVLKDVVAWAKAIELVDKHPKALFIFPIRDKEKVLNSFCKLRRVYIETRQLDKLHPRWMMGLGLFYRYFYGVLSYERVPIDRMFELTWQKYMDIVTQLENRRNVAILRFRERLMEDQIDKVFMLHKRENKKL